MPDSPDQVEGFVNLNSEIRKIPVGHLMFLPGNPRIHDEEALHDSMSFGFWGTVLVQKKKHRGKHWIIGGNGRATEAIKRGAIELDCCILDVDDTKAKAIAALDNASGDQATNDPTLLLALIREVQEGGIKFPDSIFSDQHITQLLRDVEKAGAAGGGGGSGVENDLRDTAEDLQKKWNVKLGDEWLIGSHRLLCGDTLDTDLVFNFMGSPVDMIFTDPPWNVDYGGSSNPRWRQRVDKIENDDLGDGFPMFLDALVRTFRRIIKPGGMVYVVMSAQEWGPFMAAMEKPETTKSKDPMFHWSSTIIWNKDIFVMGRKDYHPKYEPIWYGWDARAARLVPLDSRDQADVWDIERPRVSDEHPTMKPVALTAKAIFNSSRPGSVIADVFAGSGSTMEGAELHGRQCLMVENVPKNCAIILERGQRLGLDCRRVE